MVRRLKSAMVLTLAVPTLVAALALPTPAAVGAAIDTKIGEKTSDPLASDQIMSKESLGLMRRQARFEEVAKLIYKAHDQNSKDGFAGLSLEADGLVLHYKGQLTEAMGKALDAARAVGRTEVKPAAHSHAELLDAGKKIHDARKALGVRDDIQEIRYLTDGSGLVVEKMPPLASQGISRSLSAKGQAFAAAENVLAAAKVGVPVEVRTAAKTIRTQAQGCINNAAVCRHNDSPSWNGGGRFETYRGGLSTPRRAACTTGFGVKANGYYAVVTVAHCGTTPDVAYQGIKEGICCIDTRELMGPVSNDAWAYDLMLINSAGSRLIFDGGVNTSNTKTVVQYGYWMANQLVCQSGISSGVVCDLKQTSSVDVTMACYDENGNPAGDSDGDCGYTMYGMIRTEQLQGKDASKAGDSGGPVFTLMPNISQIRAKGVLSGSNGGSVMYFQDWDTIDSLFNAYPRYCMDVGGCSPNG